MNNIRPKLHVVLTASAKYAEFKCPLCRKIFISSYHLNRHTSRRHSQYCQQELLEEDLKDKLLLYQNSVQEKMRTRRVLDASKRMEQLLKNLSIEEVKMFGNGNSTPRKSVSDIIEPYISGLSPIAYNVNYLEMNPNKKSVLSDLKVINEQSKNLKFRSYHNAELGGMQELEDVGKKYGVEEKNLHNKSTDGEKTCLAIEGLPESKSHNNSILKVSSRNPITITKNVNCGTMTEDLLCDSILKVNKCQNTCAQFIENRNDPLLKSVHMSTQTEELIVQKEVEYSMEKCRTLDVYCETSILTIKHAPEEGNSITENKLDDQIYFSDMAGRGSAFIEQGNEEFEKEFRESFEARKNLLTKDDYVLNNSMDENECFDKVSEDKISIEEKVSQEEKVSPNSGELSNGECDHSHMISESRNVEQSSSNEERYNQCQMKVKCALSARLRNVGVDPNWITITNKVSEKTNSLLAVRRVNMSKKFSGYMSMRNMLNNTIEQILEAKDK